MSVLVYIYFHIHNHNNNNNGHRPSKPVLFSMYYCLFPVPSLICAPLTAQLVRGCHNLGRSNSRLMLGMHIHFCLVG